MNFHEQRRFPRVHIQKVLGEVNAILGAQITWPNLEISEVFDLSYKGLAVRRPGLYPVAVHRHLPLLVQFGAAKSFQAPARIAWCNMELVGLELTELPAEGHQAMRDYLDARLLGSSMRPVEKVYFAPSDSFNFWFQGPNGTHVFIWLNSERYIERVHLDTGVRSVGFERKQSVNLKDLHQRRALLVLSQMEKPHIPMEEFVRSLEVSD